MPHFAKLFGELGSLPGGYDLDLDGLFELGLGLLLDGVEALGRRRQGGAEREARLAQARADAARHTDENVNDHTVNDF